MSDIFVQDNGIAVLRELNWISIVLRLALAIICGGIIGIERGSTVQYYGGVCAGRRKTLCGAVAV